jgi:hypothetical protein
MNYLYIFENYDPYESQHGVLIISAPSEQDARRWMDDNGVMGTFTLEGTRELYPSAPKTELVYAINTYNPFK